MTLAKICGVASETDAEAALAAGADLIGLNFFEPSVRYVSPEIAASISRIAGTRARKVGVFVNPTIERVRQVMAAVELDLLQFHGDEDPAFCTGWPLPVIKAIRVRDRQWTAEAARFDVDFILADAFVAGAFGGTGSRVAIDLLSGFDPRRLIVAGGLRPDDVADTVRQLRPFAVDVASGVEGAPGKKDAELMRRFVAHVHAA